MKVVAVSDLHGYLPDIPSCDLLLIAGDICPAYDHSLTFQQHWLDTEFRWWLKKRSAKTIVGIAGNHDFLFQEKPHWVPKLPWIYLQDSGIEIDGLKVWGSPWQLIFPAPNVWAFNLSEEELYQKWCLIMEDTDIVVLHGPPLGYGDIAPRMNKSGFENVGSPSLLRRLKSINPKLVVFGHIHEGFGCWQDGSIKLANVSFVDAQYKPRVNGWLEIEL